MSFVFCMLSVSLCFKSSLCRHSCICVYLKVCKSIHRSVCLSLMLPAQMTLANCCLSSGLSVRIAVTKIALGGGVRGSDLFNPLLPPMYPPLSPFDDHYECFMLPWHVFVYACHNKKMRCIWVFSADSESSMDRLCICTLWTVHLLTSHCPWLTSHLWKALFLFNFLWEQNIWYVGFCECNCETFGIWWCCKKQKDYYVCKETKVRIKKQRTGERDDNKKENKGKSVWVCVDELYLFIYF